jgi:hypothetical protein
MILDYIIWYPAIRENRENYENKFPAGKNQGISQGRPESMDTLDVYLVFFLQFEKLRNWCPDGSRTHHIAFIYIFQRP